MKPNKMIYEGLRYIDEHLEERITISQISSAVGYSKSHFSRCFRKEMKVSVMNYVNKRRLIKSSEAIFNGDKIIDTAFRFGWQTHSGFTKAFKNEFGFYPALLKGIKMQISDLGGSGMEHIFLKSTGIHSTRETLYQNLKDCLKEEIIDYSENELENIFCYSCEVYKGIKRYSGDEYITHTLNVAILLVEMGASLDAVYAGLFCDALKKTPVSIEQLRKELPAKSANYIEKANMAGNILNRVDLDDEVVLIKLAERLHNMRTLNFMEDDKRKIKARETLEEILPMAQKTGMQKLVDELNDLALKYL